MELGNTQLIDTITVGQYEIKRVARSNGNTDK